MKARYNAVTILAAAAALFSFGSFSPQPAEAGVRLQFGFPLGSFVARPSGSYAVGYARGNHATRKVVRQARIVRVNPKRPVIVKPVTFAARPVVKPAIAQAPAVTDTVAATTAATTTEVAKPDAAITTAGVQALSASSAPIEEIKLNSLSADAAPPTKENIAGRITAAVAAPGDAPVTALEAKPAGSAGSDGAGECRKFVPSVGLVVSVTCGQ